MKYIIKKMALFFMIIFKRDLIIDIFSFVHPKTYRKLKGTKRNKIIIKKSVIGKDLSAEYGCIMDNIICSGKVELGRFVSLNGPGTRISSRLYGIEIGSFSSIASNVIIQEDYHRMNKVSTYFMSKNIFGEGIEKDIFSKGKIIIEEDVWIGSNSVVLSGVKIGRGSIIGAGSVVTKDIPRYSIVAGNPAKVIKTRFPEHIIAKLESSKWWNMEISEINKHKDDFNKSLDTLEDNNEIFIKL